MLVPRWGVLVPRWGVLVPFSMMDCHRIFRPFLPVRPRKEVKVAEETSLH